MKTLEELLPWDESEICSVIVLELFFNYSLFWVFFSLSCSIFLQESGTLRLSFTS